MFYNRRQQSPWSFCSALQNILFKIFHFQKTTKEAVVAFNSLLTLKWLMFKCLFLKIHV